MSKDVLTKLRRLYDDQTNDDYAFGQWCIAIERNGAALLAVAEAARALRCQAVAIYAESGGGVFAARLSLLRDLEAALEKLEEKL